MRRSSTRFIDVGVPAWAGFGRSFRGTGEVLIRSSLRRITPALSFYSPGFTDRLMAVPLRPVADDLTTGDGAQFFEACARPRKRHSIRRSRDARAARRGRLNGTSVRSRQEHRDE
jgi:hypothetical protein